MKYWQRILLALLDLGIVGLTFLPWFRVEVMEVSAYHLPQLAAEYFTATEPMRYFVYAIYIIPLISIWHLLSALFKDAGFYFLSWIQLAVVLAFMIITIFNSYEFDLDAAYGLYWCLGGLVGKVFMSLRN